MEKGISGCTVETQAFNLTLALLLFGRGYRPSPNEMLSFGRLPDG